MELDAKTNGKSPKRTLSIFVLIMLNVSLMASLRNLPMLATYGLSSLFYFFVVGLCFLLPCALISAELATGWPKDGGIYIWIREALGDRFAFMTVWMQWVHNVAWFPVILAFCASTLAYTFSPDLAHNKTYVVSVVLIGFWSMTFLNFFGIKTSSLFSTIGVIAGTILPGIFIISLGIYWLGTGRPSQIVFSLAALKPDLTHMDRVVFLAGLFLAFSGLEVSATHAGSVKNPQKNYPRSIIIAALITFCISVLGALSIAVVIPHNDISLVSGLMAAFKNFFEFYNLSWFLPVLGIMLIIGAIAELNSWIAGPVRALYATSIHGNLPPLLQKKNKHGMPTNLLLVQALIATISAFIIPFMPSVSSAFWILTALSAQTYLVMYVMMFIAAIHLRYSKPLIPRTYRVPGKMVGMWILGSLGIISSIFGICVAFIPPKELATGNIFIYEGFLILSLLALTAIPLIIYQCRKPEWYRLEDKLP